MLRRSTLKIFGLRVYKSLLIGCDKGNILLHYSDDNEFNGVICFLIHHLEAVIITLLFGCSYISFLGKSFLDLFGLPVASVSPLPKWLGKLARTHLIGVMREVFVVVVGGLR
jgi:hypothetical protein